MATTETSFLQEEEGTESEGGEMYKAEVIDQVIRCYVEGMSEEEIAEVTDLYPVAVIDILNTYTKYL